MRYFYLVIGAAIISSCSQNPGSTPYAGNALSRNLQRSGSAPAISKVSQIKAKQYQKIIISGSGFGTSQAFNGDSGYLQILDTTGGWSAGYESSTQYDSVWLDVTSWTDKKIVIKGFTGAYGESYWVLNNGDDLKINVWNTQTHAGPATKHKKVT